MQIVTQRFHLSAQLLASAVEEPCIFWWDLVRLISVG